MNTTLRAICGLLKSDNAELQRAAAMVLGRISPDDAAVSKALGEALARTTRPEVAEALLAALVENPHEQSVRHLLEALENDAVSRDGVLDAVVGAGPKALPALRKAFPTMSPVVQTGIAETAPRLRGEAAFSFFLEILQSENMEVVRSAVHALRESIGEYNKKERNQLFQRLKTGLSSKDVLARHSALLAVIICFGILEDPRAKKLLLPYVEDVHDEQTRRYALLSLGSIGLTGEGHGDVISALIPVVEEGEEALVRPAVDVLVELKPRKSDADTLERLLESDHSCVQAYAIRALGRLNTVGYARRIVEFLGHRDHNLRAAATEALAGMSSATGVVLEELQAPHDEAFVDEIVGVLKHHAKRISKDRVRTLVKQLFSWMEANDPRYLVLRRAVLAVDPEALRASVQSRVSAARRRKDFAAMRDCLELLQDSPYMTADARFQLMVAKLKTSRKEMARSARQRDVALDLVAELLHEGGKTFTRKLLKESTLDPEDLYYVGYHFSERLNEERRFGTDVLAHVAGKGKRNKTAREAREKLKIEGH